MGIGLVDGGAVGDSNAVMGIAAGGGAAVAIGQRTYVIGHGMYLDTWITCGWRTSRGEFGEVVERREKKDEGVE